MRKNKLVLASGILMIITAGYAIVSSLILMSLIANLIVANTFDFVTNPETDQLAFQLIMTYAINALFYILEVVGFLIIGIKLTRRSGKNHTFVDIKSLLIIALVFAGVAMLFDIFYMSIWVLIAIIVLLSCSLAYGDKGFKTICDINSTESKKDSISEISQTNNLAETEQINSLEDKVEVKQTQTDLMVDRIVGLKKLKENGIISEEEYITLINKSMEVISKSKMSKAKKETKKNGNK